MAKASSVRQTTPQRVELETVVDLDYAAPQVKRLVLGLDLGSSGVGVDLVEHDPAIDPRLIFANYNKLIDRVVDAFGDEITASKWLSAPSVDFDQKSPLQVARERNYELTVLEPILIRIEHGVYF